MWNDPIGQSLAAHFIQNTGYPITGPYMAMGWVNKIGLIGQAIFTDYTGANVEIHLYAPKCMNRQTVKSVYKYVFKDLKCVRLTAKPYSTNEFLLHLLPRLGFEYEGKQEKYYKDKEQIIDAMVFKLLENNIPKWVNINA